MLPEGGKTVPALTTGPEDAENQENGADDLHYPTHSPQGNPAALAVRPRYPSVSGS
jgi:hypothetical protein